MALVKKRSNSTRAAIILAVGLVVAAVGYFLFQRFSNPTTDMGNGQIDTNQKVITNFGESILDDERYKTLQPFGQDITIDPTTEGNNPNPFE